jgi:hypothetical protein
MIRTIDPVHNGIELYEAGACDFFVVLFVLFVLLKLD